MDVLGALRVVAGHNGVEGVAAAALWSVKVSPKIPSSFARDSSAWHAGTWLETRCPQVSAQRAVSPSFAEWRARTSPSVRFSGGVGTRMDQQQPDSVPKYSNGGQQLSGFDRDLGVNTTENNDPYQRAPRCYSQRQARQGASKRKCPIIASAATPRLHPANVADVLEIAALDGDGALHSGRWTDR